MSDQDLRITQDELAAFASKLERWGETLPAKERALLDVLVRLAGDGLPARPELSEEQLDAVVGGAGVEAPQGIGQKTTLVLGKLTTAGGAPDLGKGAVVIVAPR